VVPRFGQCHSGMGGVHRAASSPTEGRENDRPRRAYPRVRPPSSDSSRLLTVLSVTEGQSAEATNRYRLRLKK
jgi:hypothetical protein